MLEPGATVSQGAFEVAVKTVAFLLSITSLSPGAGPPNTWESDREVGVAVMDGATVFMENVTGMEMVLVPAVT